MTDKVAPIEHEFLSREQKGFPSWPWIEFFQGLESSSGTAPGTTLDPDKDVQTDSDGLLTSVANTGTVSNVMSESPTLTGTITAAAANFSGAVDIGSTIAIVGTIDDDTFATATNTTISTSESIKAYVDSQVTAQDLDLAGDSGTGAVDLDSQVLTIAGTASEIETSMSGQTLTIGLPSAVTIATSLGVGGALTDGTIHSHGAVFVDAGIRTRQTGSTRYRGDFFMSATRLKINAYDDTGAAYLAMFIDASSLTLNTDTSGQVLIPNGGFNIGATVLISGTIDDDTFTTASATTLATSESIKAYGDNTFALRDMYNGTIKESFDALVTSDGATITMSIEQSGGGDLIMQFSDGDTTLDCTPAATIALTAGSDTAPQANYIYILQSSKVLTKSTSAWPSAEHIKIGFFFVQSATTVQTNGALINQNWNDHIEGTDNQGHLTHIEERIRHGGANYFSGIDPNGTDQAAATSYFDDSAGAAAYFKSTSGIIYQMHKHTMPAVDTSGSDILYAVNWSGDAYHEFSDLFDITADSTGSGLNNKYFNVFFFAVGNKTGEFAPIMCKLPGGGYVTESSALNDVDGYDDRTMPREFGLDSSTGTPICRMTLKWTGGLGTLTHISTLDLRSSTVSSGTGSTGMITDFPDNQFSVFDETDTTKILNLDVGTLVTTGNTRTLQVPDSDGVIALLSDLTAEDLDFAGDSGTGAVDLDSQTFTISGTVNEVDTSASGQTITIGLPSAVTITTLTLGDGASPNVALTFDSSASDGVINWLGVSDAFQFLDDVTIKAPATLNIGSTVSITGTLDDDSFATASATTLATSESIKAYVDAQVTTSDLDFAGDSGTGAVDLDSQTFTLAGTANEIETSASGQTITIGIVNNPTITGSLTVNDNNQYLIGTGAFSNPNFHVRNTNADAFGPTILFEKWGASPADDDVIGTFQWRSHTDTGTNRKFAEITGYARDVTDATLNGTIEITVQTALAVNKDYVFADGNLNVPVGLVVNEDSDVAGDFRAESNADTHFLFLDAGAETLNIGGTGTGDIAVFGAAAITMKQATTVSADFTVATSNEVFLNLPVSAGTAGSLWNDSGTVKVA